MTLERALASGDSLEVRIESLAAGGDGVARHRGLTVFVPLTAPGDRVRVRCTEVHARYARAELIEVLEPGPDRREPACAHFTHCGGCTWLHVDDSAQSRARVEILRSSLQRIAGRRTLPEIEIMASPRALGYRARARVAYAAGRVGFRARKSHDVVDVERCAVLATGTQRALEALRAAPPRGAGEREIREFESVAAGLRVREGAFFQANAALWSTWPERVGELCGDGALAVELYAGVGFFTVELQRRFEQVVAVEREESAHDLALNTRARVHRMSAEQFAREQLAALAPDVVLLNPPRVGCDRAVIDSVRDRSPARVVFVSCDPATLARDVKLLGERYEISRVISLDAFPQTHHVESLILLRTS